MAESCAILIPTDSPLQIAAQTFDPAGNISIAGRPG
jgi:hypothetical protein